MTSRLNYWAVVALAVPFLLAGLAVGIFERCVGTDGAAAEWCARPFLRAVERGRT